MDLATVTGAYQGLKAAKEVIEGAILVKASTEANAKILEALRQLGDAQDTLFSLRDHLSKLQSENDRLHQKITKSSAWKSKTKQYELIKTEGGAVVYKFKGQPEHFACPGCFNSMQIHILQINRARGTRYNCTGCSNEFFIDPLKGISSTALQNAAAMGRKWDATNW